MSNNAPEVIYLEPGPPGDWCPDLGRRWSQDDDPEGTGRPWVRYVRVDSPAMRLLWIETRRARNCEIQRETGILATERDNLRARLKKAEARVEDMEIELKRLRRACSKANEDICQALGKALGYPWFRDDPRNFPGATEVDGVCVGDHVAETIAEEAAERIRELEDEKS